MEIPGLQIVFILIVLAEWIFMAQLKFSADTWLRAGKCR